MKRSFVDIINIIGVLIVAAVVLFSAYTLFIGAPFYTSDTSGRIIGNNEETGRYTADKPVSMIIVKNISGQIEAERWSGTKVQLNYLKHGPGSPPEVMIDLNGDTISIEAVYPKISGSFGSVDFMLKIPEMVEYIEAKSVSGKIAISGLENTEQMLTTTSGSINTDSSGNLKAASVSGSLSFSSGGKEISAATTSGSINGRLKTNLNDAKIELNSVSGRIELVVPDDLNANINLHSVSGSVSTELPAAITENKKNTLKGVIGSGGSDIDIKTVSGAIRIKK